MFEMKRPLFPEILALHGKWRSHKPAIVSANGVTNWGEFIRTTDRVANGLRAAGLDTGDRVGIVMSNEPATIEVIFSTIRTGMIAVPINLSVTDSAMETMLNDAGISALFVSADQVWRTDAVRANIPSLKENALFCAGTPSAPLPAAWQSYEEWLARQKADDNAVSIAENSPSNIIYSSGTTGVPKGIVHTQLGRLDWAYDLSIALRYHSGARTLLTLGLYSNISWVMMLCTLLAGGTLVVQQSFEAGSVLHAIAEHRITHTAMVPTQYRRLLDHRNIREAYLSTVQAIMSCGSPLPPDLKARLFEVFPCGVIELYGLTEGVITTLDPEDAAGRLASVGKPIQGTDIKLIDEDGHEVPRGDPGEVVGLCRFTMQGYWNRADATAEATWLDKNGQPWLRTGDIGRLDQEGFLYLVDRKKDLILSGGQNIYPADIETVLLSHDAVLECAVIGVPHAEWGETPFAVVVPRTNAPTPEEMRAWVNARVGKQQRVSAVVFKEQLPRNPNGKVLKRELRVMFRA